MDPNKRVNPHFAPRCLLRAAFGSTPAARADQSRTTECDRIIEAELDRRMREASYKAAGFPRETWARTYGAA